MYNVILTVFLRKYANNYSKRNNANYNCCHILSDAFGFYEDTSQI